MVVSACPATVEPKRMPWLRNRRGTLNPSLTLSIGASIGFPRRLAVPKGGDPFPLMEQTVVGSLHACAFASCAFLCLCSTLSHQKHTPPNCCVAVDSHPSCCAIKVRTRISNLFSFIMLRRWTALPSMEVPVVLSVEVALRPSVVKTSPLGCPRRERVLNHH